MKILTITILALALLLTTSINSAIAANDITQRLSGRLLLQVQDGGRIWWVNPVDLQKYEVTFTNALELFRGHALGISNQDLSKIKINAASVSCCSDADNDGYEDQDEVSRGYNPFGPGKQVIDQNLSQRLAGRMLLQVEDMGRVWYVDPVSLTMYEVKFATLMDLFRGLALGITNNDLSKIVTSLDMRDWQHYEHDFFSFNYPANWTLKETDYQNVYDVQILRNFDGLGYCVITTEFRNDGLEFDETNDDYIYFKQNGYQEQSISIDGIQAARLSTNISVDDKPPFNEGAGMIADVVKFSRGENNFRIIRKRDIYNQTWGAENNCLDTFNQILINFRFFDKNFFDINKIKAGDTVAGMKVISVKSVSSELPIDRETNIVIEFSGQAVLEGKYKYYKPGEGSISGAFFSIDGDELSKLPLPSGYDRDGFGFYFSNQNFVEKQLGVNNLPDTVTIVIDNFTYVIYPSELAHQANLIRVLDES